ncbi:MAG: pantoate kinase [Candidatus Hodarchaeota archaeon]
MTDDVSYWVASHLTGIFEIRDRIDDLLRKGSRGAGLSINRGVITTISLTKRSNVQIYFDGRERNETNAAVTTKVLEILLPKKERVNLRVDHTFQVPLSSGYGASAAGAVGTAFALNDLLELGLSELELFQIAHKAEILTKSGLGDVIGIYQGGIEIRLKEGAPGFGETMPINNTNGWKVATVHFGTLPTSEVLSDHHKRKAVNDAGRELISELILQPYFSNFIKLSAIFSVKANLWSKRLQNHVKNLPNSVVGSQIMLGEAFFIFYHDHDDLRDIKVPGTQIHQETICQDTIVKCEE